jgi:cyclopropane fatty-acyl-phospholipid synthase-like methyltransferase
MTMMMGAKIMSITDSTVEKIVRQRPAFKLLHGYILCSVLAAMEDARMLEKLQENGIRADQIGGNGMLAERTLLYLSQRGIVELVADRYQLTPFGAAVIRDRGHISWIAGGFGEPFRRFGELLRGTAKYGSDIVRDGRIVAVSSHTLGKEDLQPYVMSLLQEIPFDRVADLGCGSARFLINLCRERGTGGVGVDIDQDACKEAETELAAADLADKVTIIEADASDASAIPELASVQLVVSFFFLHEVLGKGYDALINFLRDLSAMLPAGAHVLAAELAPQADDRANEQVYAPEFSLIHALMGQDLLGEEGWSEAFAKGGFVVRRIIEPNIPRGLLILAQKVS